MFGSLGMRPHRESAGLRLALVIATDIYADLRLNQLRAPAQDANDMADVLRDPDIGNFTVIPVVNRPEYEVRRSADAFLSGRSVDDLVVVYLSCHGVLDARGRLYFATTDTSKDSLSSTAVESAWLLNRLEDCRARRQVLILDCCFSGSFANAKASAEVDLDRRLLGSGRGRVVLTASRAGEYSYEGKLLPGAIDRSLFTAALVEGLRTGNADFDGDGYITIEDAYRYVADRIKAVGGEQNPQLWLHGGEGAIVLARRRRDTTAITNTGPHADDVNLVTGAPIRIRYREQVRRIAPPKLVGREPELAELKEFCTNPSYRGAYSWWRGEAWVGKSALMSWFVLHPPDDVRILPFFITARLSGQSDRQAFIDNVLEQLTTLLGEEMPALLTESTRDAHLLGLLRDAAQACHERGDNFVLLVDGLDEDRGVNTGPDAHSIAALLPVDPPAGMRIIVASRPNPPIPPDVVEHHPLRDPGIVRSLDRSPTAQAVQVDMERELKRLIAGTPVEQDLLGLLTAANGGLTASDLAELTDWPSWKVDEHLCTVAGRSFTRRDAHWQPETRPEVYLLGHEELQMSALRFLGPQRLDTYRQRLHAWADKYRAMGWPHNTPEYLLRGYYGVLATARDLPRMLLCATDPARHDRMLDISGGDTAALSEITTAIEMIVGEKRPDVGLMARLVIHRDRLIDRNSRIPAHLAATWATLGYSNRAETLARSITNTDQQAGALAALAQAFTTAGNLDRADMVARSIERPEEKTRALISLTRALAMAGDRRRARAVATDAQNAAHAIDHNHKTITALARLAQVMAAAGDLRRARAVAADADKVAHLIHRNYKPTAALAQVVQAMAAVGDLHRARAIVAEMEDAVGDVDYVSAQWKLVDLTEAAAAAGLLDRAETIARSIPNPYQRSTALALLIQLMADGSMGHARRLATDAETIARNIADPDNRSWTLASVARAVLAVGDLEYGHRLAIEAEEAAHTIDDLGQRCRALASLVQVIAAAGDLDHAEIVARAIPLPDQQSKALASLVQAPGGDLARIDAIVRSIQAPASQSWAMTSLARAAAAAGRLDQARTLATDAEKVARTIRDPFQESMVLISLARAVAATGDIDQAHILASEAEGSASAIHDPGLQSDALAKLVRVVLTDLEWAEKIARSIPNSLQQDAALALLAETLVKVGDLDRAKTIARAVRNLSRQHLLLTSLAEFVAKSGDFDSADAVACSIIDPGQRSHALILVIRAAAGNLDSVHVLAAHAEEAVGAIGERALRNNALVSLTKALIEAGDLVRAEAIGRSINNRKPQGEALAYLTEAIAKSGDLNRASSIAFSIEDPYHAIVSVLSLALTVAASGDLNRARALIIRADKDMRALHSGSERDKALSLLALAMAVTGDLAGADTVVRTIRSEDDKRSAVHSIIKATVATGDLNRIEEVGRHYVGQHARTLLVKAMVAAGDLDQADAVIRANFRASEDYLAALKILLDAMVTAGNLRQVRALVTHMEKVALSVSYGQLKCELLILLIKGLAAGNEVDWARRLAVQAEKAALSVDRLDLQGELLETLTKAVTAAGGLEQAELIARSIRHRAKYLQAYTFLAMNTVLAQTGRPVVRLLEAQRWTAPLDVLAETHSDVLQLIISELSFLSKYDGINSSPSPSR